MIGDINMTGIRLKKLFCLLAVLVGSMAIRANVWTPDNLPVPANTCDSVDVNYVCNPDGILSREDVDSINRLFFVMERDKGVRGLVIAVEEIDPDDPYEFTISVANKYGIGGKTNTGIVVMVATVSRAVSILTGEGMEKFITDGQCGYIRRNVMTPLLKEERWGEGIIAACNKISAVVLEQEELNADDESEEVPIEDVGEVLMWTGLGIAGLAGYGLYRKKKARQCPRCKKYYYKMKLRQVAVAEGEEGALPQADNETALHTKLLAMKLQNKRQLMDVMGQYQQGDIDSEGLRNALAACRVLSQEDVDDILSYVTPAIAASAIQLAKDKKAFDNEYTHTKKQRRLLATHTNYRKVHLTDVYSCPICGYQARKESVKSASGYQLGLFTSGTFGAIYATTSSSDSRVYGGSSSGSSSYSSGGHSWGSSGGGSFGGGGSSGRF